jgi:hypothetical protein
VSTTNRISYQLFIQWTADGPKRWERLSLLDVYQPWKLIEPVPHWARGAVHCYGDSLTADGYAKFLATYLTVPVTNRGKSGDTSNDVLLRAGVIRLYAVPVGGSIPTSGTVALDTFGRRLTTRDNRAIAVVWKGVPGTLTHTTGEAWTFTRTTAGTAVPVTEATPFLSTQLAPVGATQVFWFGTNDAWFGGFQPDTDLLSHIAGNYARAADSVLADSERHVLLFGMVTTRSTVKGDPLDVLVAAVNQRVAARDPHLFLPVQEYMVRQCMADMGLTPTQADTTAAAAGLIPPQLYEDDLHFTQAAQTAIAQYLVAPALKARGWA